MCINQLCCYNNQSQNLSDWQQQRFISNLCTCKPALLIRDSGKRNSPHMEYAHSSGREEQESINSHAQTWHKPHLFTFRWPKHEKWSSPKSVKWGDFPVGPVAPWSQSRGPSSIPSWETEFPHAAAKSSHATAKTWYSQRKNVNITKAKSIKWDMYSFHRRYCKPHGNEQRRRK